MTLDELRQRLARMKGEPAPPYILDDTGIAYRAMEVRSRKRWHEWNDDKPSLNDEIPY